jgi:hypothetical protein
VFSFVTFVVKIINHKGHKEDSRSDTEDFNDQKTPFVILSDSEEPIRVLANMANRFYNRCFVSQHDIKL